MKTLSDEQRQELWQQYLELPGDDDTDQAFDVAYAAGAAAKGVPREPTQAMLRAGLSRHLPQSMSGERLTMLWRAMHDAHTGGKDQSGDTDSLAKPSVPDPRDRDNLSVTANATGSPDPIAAQPVADGCRIEIKDGEVWLFLSHGDKRAATVLDDFPRYSTAWDICVALSAPAAPSGDARDAARERNALCQVIEWALGEGCGAGDEFPDWPATVTITGNPKYWWRNELRRRYDAAIAAEGEK